MVSLSGKAFYVGYLKGCTVYADLNGDLVQDEGEPTSTTDEYGGWTLAVEETAPGNAEVIVTASPDCIDRSTSLPLAMPLRSPVGCEVASILSDLKYTLGKTYAAEGMPEAEAATAANGAIANALGLTDEPSFDVCTFDPLAQLWGAQFGAARRLLEAGHHLELLGVGRRLEEATEVLSAYLALNLQLVTLVSGVASVTGFEGDAAYASSADAILGSVVAQLIEHSAEVASGTAAAGDSVEIDATKLVTAAEAAAGVTLGPSLAAALADSTAATADYVAAAAAASVATASSSSDALRTIATVGVVAQTDDPAVGTLLTEARARGSSDLSGSAAAATLSASLIAASTPAALDDLTLATTVPVPEDPRPLPPSPSPPPSPSAPPSLPPPPLPRQQDAIQEQQEANQEIVEETGEVSWAIYLLLLLLVPTLCFGCLCFRYPGNVALWCRHRFSHSSPKLMVLYLPEETRENMRSTLSNNRRDHHALPLRRLFTMNAKVRIRTAKDGAPESAQGQLRCSGSATDSDLGYDGFAELRVGSGAARDPRQSADYSDLEAHIPSESEDLSAGGGVAFAAGAVPPTAGGAVPPAAGGAVALSAGGAVPMDISPGGAVLPPMHRPEVADGVDARCAESSGATLLIAAAFGGQEAIVRMLLQRGASVDLQDSTGSTALMGGAAMGHLSIVQALLDAKADASLQTKGGRTALMGAEHHDHTEIALLLRKASSIDARLAAAASEPKPAAAVAEKEPLPEAVRLAAEEGEMQAVAAWLDRNWGVNRKGCSPPAIQVSFTTQPQAVRPSTRLLRI